MENSSTAIEEGITIRRFRHMHQTPHSFLVSIPSGAFLTFKVKQEWDPDAPSFQLMYKFIFKLPPPPAPAPSSNILKILSWNCNGTTTSDEQGFVTQVNSMVSENQPHILVLLDTRIKGFDESWPLIDRLPFTSYLLVPGYDGKSGGICVLWNMEIVQVRHSGVGTRQAYLKLLYPPPEVHPPPQAYNLQGQVLGGIHALDVGE